jgi:ubiquinone/menaquinone biosynthesis C-methylase UbiE
MKTRLLSPKDLVSAAPPVAGDACLSGPEKGAGGYGHPATILFRSIELRAIYENTRDVSFRHPSLDLGCGDGYISSLLFDERFTYGMDNGEARDAHIAREHLRYEHILLESAERMSLPDNSLNFVFCNSVIEHIPDNEAVLGEIARTLRTGGDFVFTAPSHKFEEWLCFSNPFYVRFRQKWLNHYHTVSHSEWQRRLERHGLEVKRVAYYISRTTNRLWDRMALEVRIRGLFDKNAENRVCRKHMARIEERYRADLAGEEEGASLFIHAVRR